MVIRVFSIQKDGSYVEVGNNVESLSKGDGAFLILDIKDKLIYIYRREGIPNTLAYAAGRAATNLNTKRNSKYKIINIEQEDKLQKLSTIFNINEKTVKMLLVSKHSETLEENSTISKESKVSPIGKPQEIIKSTELSSIVDRGEEQQKEAVEKVEEQQKEAVEKVEEQQKEVDINLLLKTFGLKLFLEEDIDELKAAVKPPKEELDRILYNKIKELLNKIY